MFLVCYLPRCPDQYTIMSVHSLCCTYMYVFAVAYLCFSVQCLRSPLFTPPCALYCTLHSALHSSLRSALFTPLCTLYSQLRSAFRTLYSAVGSALYPSCVLFILECCIYSVMHLCIFHEVFVYSLYRAHAFSVLYLCICCGVSVLFCAVSMVVSIFYLNRIH